MITSTTFCADCRHAALCGDWSDGIDRLACTHPSVATGEKDPVTGHMDFPLCASARGDATALCGPTAQLWEAKPATNLQLYVVEQHAKRPGRNGVPA